MINFDESFWVAAALFLFIFLIFKPLGRVIAAALDKRSERIQNELEEALRLKEEAQAILAAFQRDKRKVSEEIEEIMEHARAEAERITKKARDSVESALNKKTELAMEKISQAEKSVVNDIRNNTVDIVMNAARMLISDNLNQDAADDILEDAVSNIGRKLH